MPCNLVMSKSGTYRLEKIQDKFVALIKTLDVIKRAIT